MLTKDDVDAIKEEAKAFLDVGYRRLSSGIFGKDENPRYVAMKHQMVVMGIDKVANVRSHGQIETLRAFMRANQAL